ncbi:hypothetical protein DFJ73DRAFT_537299 [Zopfochytrium polystomum]|nr:hypothetical protein DFJ73DRAFT_537299 [Zopfochytrium polystomum]
MRRRQSREWRGMHGSPEDSTPRRPLRSSNPFYFPYTGRGEFRSARAFQAPFRHPSPGSDQAFLYSCTPPPVLGDLSVPVAAAARRNLNNWFLVSVPFDVLVEIVGHIRVADIVQLSIVCRQLYAAFDDRFWSAVLRNRLSDSLVPPRVLALIDGTDVVPLQSSPSPPPPLLLSSQAAEVPGKIPDGSSHLPAQCDVVAPSTATAALCACAPTRRHVLPPRLQVIRRLPYLCTRCDHHVCPVPHDRFRLRICDPCLVAPGVLVSLHEATAAPYFLDERDLATIPFDPRGLPCMVCGKKHCDLEESGRRVYLETDVRRIAEEKQSVWRSGPPGSRHHPLASGHVGVGGGVNFTPSPCASRFVASGAVGSAHRHRQRSRSGGWSTQCSTARYAWDNGGIVGTGRQSPPQPHSPSQLHRRRFGRYCDPGLRVLTPPPAPLFAATPRSGGGMGGSSLHDLEHNHYHHYHHYHCHQRSRGSQQGWSSDAFAAAETMATGLVGSRTTPRSSLPPSPSPSSSLSPRPLLSHSHRHHFNQHRQLQTPPPPSLSQQQDFLPGDRDRGRGPLLSPMGRGRFGSYGVRRSAGPCLDAVRGRL